MMCWTCGWRRVPAEPARWVRTGRSGFRGLATAALMMVTAGSVRWLASAGTFGYVTGEGERADLYVEFAPGHGISRAAGEKQVTNPCADLQARFVQVRHVRA